MKSQDVEPNGYITDQAPMRGIRASYGITNPMLPASPNTWRSMNGTCSKRWTDSMKMNVVQSKRVNDGRLWRATCVTRRPTFGGQTSSYPADRGCALTDRRQCHLRIPTRYRRRAPNPDGYHACSESSSHPACACDAPRPGTAGARALGRDAS